MTSRTKLGRFANFAWFVLGWNLVVILWGVFLRASKSGDGCGQHWLTCQGEVIPSAPELKTVIEYSHRITTSLAGLLIVILLGWAIRRWYIQKDESSFRTMVMAIVSLFFVISEGLIGAGLVLTGNTAETLTAARPFWMAGHLLNTFVLLAFLTLTARCASGGRPPRFDIERKYLAGIAVGVTVLFIVGITGSLAALASMIFPSGTLAQGLTQDFSSTSNVLLRLRLLHPITAILTSVFLVFLAGWLAKESGDDVGAKRWSNVLSLLVLAQIAFGSATLLMRVPIVMQLGHLFLADAIWISYVLLAANFLSANRLAGTAAPLPPTLDEAVE